MPQMNLTPHGLAIKVFPVQWNLNHRFGTAPRAGTGQGPPLEMDLGPLNLPTGVKGDHPGARLKTGLGYDFFDFARRVALPRTCIDARVNRFRGAKTFFEIKVRLATPIPQLASHNAALNRRVQMTERLAFYRFKPCVGCRLDIVGVGPN